MEGSAAYFTSLVQQVTWHIFVCLVLLPVGEMLVLLRNYVMEFVSV